MLVVHRHKTYLQVDKERTVGADAFSRIAPAIPSVADVVSCSNLFNILTASTGRRLSFANYEKYLSTLNRYLYHFICNSSQCDYWEKFITRMVVVLCLGKRMISHTVFRCLSSKHSCFSIILCTVLNEFTNLISKIESFSGVQSNKENEDSVRIFFPRRPPIP